MDNFSPLLPNQVSNKRRRDPNYRHDVLPKPRTLLEHRLLFNYLTDSFICGKSTPCKASRSFRDKSRLGLRASNQYSKLLAKSTFLGPLEKINANLLLIHGGM